MSNISIYTRNFSSHPPTSVASSKPLHPPKEKAPQQKKRESHDGDEHLDKQQLRSLSQGSLTHQQQQLLQARSRLSLPQQQHELPEQQKYNPSVESHLSLEKPTKRSKAKDYKTISKQDVRMVFSSFIL